MRLILKPSIGERLKEMIYQAKREFKDIEAIILTGAEYLELKREYNVYQADSMNSTFMGIPIRTEVEQTFNKNKENKND